MRISFQILVVTSAVAVLNFSCGPGDPEQDVVDSFFRAVQQGDEVGAQRVSVVEFDGSVESWEIVERGAESEAPFALAELEAELESKQEEVREQKDSNQRFIGDNNDTYEAYRNAYAADPSAGFQGELASFHEALQERRKRLATLEADAQQLAFDVEALTNVATLSLRSPVDSSFEGRVVEKPLQVRINDGSGDSDHTVVLQRYELVHTALNRTPTAQWIIIDIQPNG